MIPPDTPAIKAVILGGNGAMGALFCASFAGAGIAVTAVDLAPAPAARQADTAYIAADVRALPEDAGRALAAADWVVAALPEGVLLETWPDIVALLKPGTLFVDTLSVKLPLIDAMAGRLPASIEALSINPMFAPALGFAGQNVAVVELRRAGHADQFLGLLQQWGARLQRLDAAQHDRYAAMLQSATHAAILAFGLALRRLGYEPEGVQPIMTPPHRALLALLARMLKASPEVYWDIQAMNPYAGEARQALADGLHELTIAIEGGDPARFRHLLAGLQDLLGAERLAELNEHSARMLRRDAD